MTKRLSPILPESRSASYELRPRLPGGARAPSPLHGLEGAPPPRYAAIVLTAAGSLGMLLAEQGDAGFTRVCVEPGPPQRRSFPMWDNRAVGAGRVQTTNAASAEEAPEARSDRGPSAEELSFTAELLWLAIDPAKGGLFPHHRRRFRKALALAHQVDRGASRVDLRQARREAIRELERLGLVQPKRALGRLRLADRARAEERSSELLRRMREDELSDSRDKELLLLLAGSGVLAHRLTYEERRLAARRMRTFVRPSSDREALSPPPRGARVSPKIRAAFGGDYAGYAIGAEGFGLGCGAGSGGGDGGCGGGYGGGDGGGGW